MKEIMGREVGSEDYIEGVDFVYEKMWSTGTHHDGSEYSSCFSVRNPLHLSIVRRVAELESMKLNNIDF